MAIWQYQLFLVPEEEMTSYFGDEESITLSDFDEIEWWKYRQLDLKQFMIPGYTTRQVQISISLEVTT